VAQRIRIDFELISETGQVLAKNYTEIFVFPRIPSTNVSLVVHDPTNKLAALTSSLQSAGFMTAPRRDIKPVIITKVLDEWVVQQMKNGLSVICLTDTNTKLPEGFPAKLESRKSAWYDGNWASNLNWLNDKCEPFKSVNFAKHLGCEGSYAIPNVLLADVKPENFSDVLAGMFVGWLHLNSAYLLQMNAGRGKLLVCCFPLTESFDNDPYSASLLDRIIQYAANPDLKPTMTWNFR
jgi:hypothetical protein